MRLLGPLLGLLRVGRLRDWYRFAWIRLRSSGHIEAAALPHIDPPFRLRMSRGSRLVLGRNVRFRPGFSADLEGAAVLEIGDHTAFNVNCWIGVTTRVAIGRACLVGPMVTVTDGNHSFDSDELIWAQGLDTREIVIGDDVWIGAKATIIHDVGSGAVVGANAVVTHPVHPRDVVVGVPARALRRRGEPATAEQPATEQPVVDA